MGWADTSTEIAVSGFALLLIWLVICHIFLVYFLENSVTEPMLYDEVGSRFLPA